MSRHSGGRQASGSALRRATGAVGRGGLLACLVVLSCVGCARSGHDAARDRVLERAGQIAHETEAWATDSHSLSGWASNESVLDRLVALTGGEQLASSVHDPDDHGVGLLARVEVAMVGAAADTWLGEETHYNICVRFDVTRQSSGPREIAPVSVDCPPRVPETRSPH
ncbi:hypothetical protein ACLQ20_05070 [Micromonospora sp. DT46]|uniref:hypothetical protein n=1 Tax=Micromonospora sp. DT46 TaxID=3393435 RepID=UPI003CE912D2